MFVIGSFEISTSKTSASQDDVFYGVKVGRSSDYFIPINTPFPFNQKIFGLNSMWNVSQPTKITIPITGIWQVGAEITTLGLNYSQYEASRVILEIVKNWSGNEASDPHLYHDICWGRFETQNQYGANGNNVSCPVYLLAGDVIEIVITGRPTTLKIESNPNGTSTLSPLFSAYYLGSLP